MLITLSVTRRVPGLSPFPVAMLLLPSYPHSSLFERRRGHVYNALNPPIKVVLVQPTENEILFPESGKRDSLKRIQISPDFGSLVVRPQGKGSGARADSAPPPLPEPTRVDRERVLRDVLSGQEEKEAKREVEQQTSKSEVDLEEVPLVGGSGPHKSGKDYEEPRDRQRLVRLFEQLLSEIYPGQQKDESRLGRRASDYRLVKGDGARGKLHRHHSHCGYLETPPDLPTQLQYEPSPEFLSNKCARELSTILEKLKWKVESAGDRLVGLLEERDRLNTEHQGLCDLMTACLQAISSKTSEDTDVKFSVGPGGGGDSGFGEWAKAMKMVARLPDGVPPHFRKTLWLSLAEKHLASKNIAWHQVERTIFSDRLNPDDQELSVQIVKDLHRTGCSLFCGSSGQHNQAVLKRVLLAYARWNKTVGYCQGLNMLAALILQVMQGCQGATVKVMIYLIEGVLPESYFADNLRGLSVDMAVFRDLLSLKVPELSKHLDALQQEAKESGTSYEPPLMDVFTMQWFLTIFCNCLPQPTVLRLWDLLFLEGDSVLIKAALVIWQNLSERMLSVRSADEFYSIMAVLTREMMEFGLMDANNIIKAMDLLSIPELSELRERYVYNISPWPVAAKKSLRVFYPQQNHGDDSREPRMTPISNHPDREKIALDISALKKQYWKLRERQRQAHIILSAACRNETYTAKSSPALNHLLLGKSALKSVKARVRPGETLHWRDTSKPVGEGPERRCSVQAEPEVERARRRPVERRRVSSSSSSSSSSTELCDSSGDSATEESPSHAPPSSPLLPRSSAPLPSSPPLPSPSLPHLSSSPLPSSPALPSSPSLPSSFPPRPPLSPTIPTSPCHPPSSHSLPSSSASLSTCFPPQPPLSPTSSRLPSSSQSLSSSFPPLQPSSPPLPSSSPSLPSSFPPQPPLSPTSSRLPSSSPPPPSTSPPLPSPSPKVPTSSSFLSSTPSSSPPSHSVTSSTHRLSWSHQSESLPPPSMSPSVPQLVNEAARKRDELMRILKENSEMLGRFRHSSTSPTMEEPPSLPRFRHHSPEEPEDIKDIRRRYSVDPFPSRAAAKPREVGIKLGLYSQPS